jgi:nucleotide-binding universal stress UspA family protein
MIDIKQILCPIDFSEFSRHALDYAVGMARWYGASLRLLHVHHVLPVASTVPEMIPSMALTPACHQQLLRSLEGIAANAGADAVALTLEVAEGLPAHEIVRAARQADVDLVVVGTHGRSGFAHLVLGSVAERVLRTASCPVLTIPRRFPDAAPVGPLFKRILCAVDFSLCSMRALKYATSLAQEADAQLTIAHVFELEGALPLEWRDTLTPGFIRGELLKMEGERREHLARAVPDAVREFCRVDTVMTSGTPYREVLRLAEETGAELIVLGVHGRNPVDLAFFGSTANHVVRQARCPVLTVRST